MKMFFNFHKSTILVIGISKAEQELMKEGSSTETETRLRNSI